jgi:pyruvate formate lyase activating enzyme
MNFGAITKFSAIDYPDGHLACVLGAQGCNFRCGWCHNGHLVKKTNAAIAANDILAFLRKRSRQLDAVVITGGEPTLQADMPAFCTQIKRLGYKIKLDTNGSRPEMIARLIQDRTIDYVAMDIKTLPAAYARLSREPDIAEKVLESIRILMRQAPAYEFRTTCVRPFISEEIILSISKLIQGASRYFLQPCRQTDVMNPGFFAENPPPQTNLEIEALQRVAAPLVTHCTVR